MTPFMLSRWRQALSHSIRGQFAIFDFDHTLIDGDITDACLALAEEEGLLTLDSLQDSHCPVRRNPFNGSLFRYYERIQRFGYAYACLWVQRIFSGLQVREVETLVQTLLTRRKPLRLDQRRRMPPPRPRSVVETILDWARRERLQIRIVSASGYLPVATAATSLFAIPRRSVAAITPQLRLANGTRAWADNVSREHRRVARLCDRFRHPLPIQEGKLKVIRSFISFRNKPILVASDSPHDEPLLSYVNPDGLSLYLPPKSTRPDKKMIKRLTEQKIPIRLFCS